MTEKPIYLDNHATTPVDPRVLDAMMPYFKEEFGNPASRSHSYGWKAEHAVETAREHVAALMGAKPHEIVFTSGATEANNMVVRGFKNAVISAIEHKSMMAPCNRMVALGGNLSFAPVDGTGRVDICKLEDIVKARLACGPHPLLVSVIAASNEVGTIQRMCDISKMAARYEKVRFHSDTTQAVGKTRVNMEAWGLHMASLSSHKIYGPKGVGALFVRDDVRHEIPAMMLGGGQEGGRRSGTVNVPAVVGFGEACRIASLDEVAYIFMLRERLEVGLANQIPGLKVYGRGRVAGNLCVSLPCEDMDLFMSLVGEHVALSMGSACMSSGSGSHVLKAMGVAKEEAMRSIRMCVGRFNTEEDINRAVEKIVWALRIANSGG